MAKNFAKISNGQNFKGQASAPSSPDNGDVYYDSTRNTFSEYINGFWFDHASKTDVASASSLTSANFTATVVQSSLVKITGSTSGNIHGLTASGSAKTVLLYNASSVIQVIKNQSATEGTAANRITTAGSADVTVSAGQSALLVYDITAATWVLISVSGTGTGGGSKNYISTYLNNPGNGDFENGSTSGWSLSHSTLDANNKMPNQASGSWTAASGNLSISATNSSPLGGTYSLQETSSAATVAGDMLVSSAFTIDAEDQNQVLAVQLNFKVTASASNGNFSGTIANSFSVAMYDVTNGTWIQVSNNYGLIQGARTTQFYGTFQTSLTGTQYRLAVYNMNATSGAITFYVDEFRVGPQNGFAGTAFKAPTVQTFTSGSGTYTLPTGPMPAFIRIRMAGAGGGGAGSGSGAFGAAPTGGNGSTFGSSLLTASGGNAAGANSGNGSAGGGGSSNTVNSPAIAVANINGQSGQGGRGGFSTAEYNSGACGGSTPFFGGGGQGNFTGAGRVGVPNTGGGGGGGGNNLSANIGLGGAGASGGYIEAIITSPNSSYSYSVGVHGSGGGAGTNGFAGGDGADGIIIVEEFYSSSISSGGALASTGPTVQRFLSGSGTYTLPTGPIPSYIVVEMVGGGGGGSASGTAGAGNGGNGGQTTFGSSLLTANGGSGGQFQGGPGNGGSATVNSPALQEVAVTGGNGGGYDFSSPNNPVLGGMGGNSALGGGGGSVQDTAAAGFAGATNTGGGGSGGGSSGASNIYGGAGGGAGGYLRAIIVGPSTSYSYSVGAGGSAGSPAGTSGTVGGAGGSGFIRVTEYYPSAATPAIVGVKKAPTVQTFTSGSGTYVLPTGPIPLYLKVTCVGGGGGGGCSGTSSTGTSGSNGTDTTFGTSLLVAGKGFTSGTTAGSNSGGGSGGGNTFGSAQQLKNIGGGNGWVLTYGPTTIATGGSPGGVNPMGGAGSPQEANPGGTGIPNTGSGGAGGGTTAGSSAFPGTGGGAGAYLEAIIYNPLTSYSYSVGAGGSGGGAGTNGQNGGAGGSGLIIVEEFYS